MKTHTTQSGFAMLFTVLVVSIILTIAIGIANITFKQGILSNLARDSQMAFFAADSGIECGMYTDFIGFSSGEPNSPGYFPPTAGPTMVMQSIPTSWCGSMNFTISQADSRTGYFVYKETLSNQNDPCRVIIFDRTDPSKKKILSRGYNTCTPGVRQVERALEVSY